MKNYVILDNKSTYVQTTDTETGIQNTLFYLVDKFGNTHTYDTLTPEFAFKAFLNGRLVRIGEPKFESPFPRIYMQSGYLYKVHENGEVIVIAMGNGAKNTYLKQDVNIYRNYLEVSGPWREKLLKLFE